MLRGGLRKAVGGLGEMLHIPVTARCFVRCRMPVYDTDYDMMLISKAKSLGQHKDSNWTF